MRLPAPRYLLLLAALFPLFWLAASALSYFVAVAKCDGRSTATDAYIAYCLDRAFGDFEHEAFFFGLERVPTALAETKVLFLGNSKLQYAFSRDNVAPFFAERGVPFFVMGFGHGEQSRFPQMVLERHPARPVLAVINVDPFFTDGITEPAAFPLQHPVAGRIDATFKSLMQRPRAWLCRRDPTLALCAGKPAMTRSRITGQWNVAAFRQGAEPTLPLPPAAVDDGEIDRWLARAIEIAPAFLKTVHARCVIFTAVPSAAGDRAARRLADRLGVPFIAPEIDGLATIDGVHLDARSGIAWSDAFLRALEPVGRECGAW
ncbi:MAG: hypothetical protein ACOY4R_17010 [Pseudomonadota bacterium]